MPRGLWKVVFLVLLSVPPTLAQLPPEILADRYLLQADQQIAKNDQDGALGSLQKILALQKEHGLTLPEAFHFKYAQVAFAAGSFPAALESVNQYLVTAGREGEFYQKALELLLAIQAAADRTPCAGQPKGAECWLELSNPAGCYIWNPQFDPSKAASWTGECSGGVAQGRGTLKWVWNGGQRIEEGSYVEGKRHGQWVFRFASGAVWEGPYVNGRKQGNWVEGKWKGAYLKDKKHGDWIELYEAGSISQELPYVQGQPHGRWVGRRKDGSVFQEGTYVEGQRHGRWVDKYEKAAGEYWGEGSGFYTEGQRHGFWRWRNKDGASAMGPYVQGKEHGDWTIRDENGNVEEGPFVEGKRDGPWLLYSEGKKERDSISTLIYDNGRIAPVPLESEMAVIPAGQYRMGSSRGAYRPDEEQPVHEVQVESFELGKYEVTFEEYDRFTAATGRERVDDEGWGRGRRPVVNVSWEDAVAYTRWLSEQTGKRYRLPSEAEWEYAVRAGVKKKKYSWGNEIGHNRANCDGCGSQWDDRQTATVGSFAPNAWGLHDMHGNVQEWVQDCWNDSYRGAPADGSAWERGNCFLRVLRGGSWNFPPFSLRSADRSRNINESRYSGLGFRLAHTHNDGKN